MLGKKFGYLILLLAIAVISVFVFKSEFHSSRIKANESKENESPRIRTEIQKERDEYFFRLLRDPATNSIPANILQQESEFIASMGKTEMQLLKSNGSLGINWQQAGPNDVGGRTRALAIDVKDNNTIIAGGVSGGIWKSTDRGLTWKMKSTLSQILSITSIAQDTRNGFEKNWYAVSGEYRGNSASASGASFYGGGFYKSTDNGETWKVVISTSTTSWSSDFSITVRVIVNPVTGSVFVATNSGTILKSADGGSNWNLSKGKINDHSYTDIAVNQNGNLVVVFSKSGFNSSPTDPAGVFKSTDDGVTWTSITPSTYPTASQRSVLAFTPSKPNIFYVLTNTGNRIGSTTREDIRLHKINFSSEESIDLSGNLPELTPTNSTSATGVINTQGNYNMAIAVHPVNENLILIGATNLFRSTDGFTTKPASSKYYWIGGYSYDPQKFFYPGLHPDIHTIIFDPNDQQKVWVGHDGGISLSDDITSTSFTNAFFLWYDRDKDYIVTQYYTVALSQTNGDIRIFGGTQDNGSPFFKLNGAATSSSYDVTSGDGSYCYLGTDYAYGSTQNGSVSRYLYKNDGEVDQYYWSNVTPLSATGQLFINPFVVDPNDENFMYYISGSKFWRNNQLSSIPDYQRKTSQGWTTVDLGLPATGNYIYSTLAVSKLNTKHTLYVGAYSGSDKPILIRMDDCRTATEATQIPLSFISKNGAYLHSIAVNPDNSNELMIAFSNYNVESLFYSSDGGNTWTNVEGNLTVPSVRSVSILPTANGKIFLAGTSTGLYSTTKLNGANTIWIPEGSDVIGNVVVEYVASRKSDGTIAVGTHGRGVFVGRATVTNVNENMELPSLFVLDQNYPNPFNPTTTIKFSIPAVETYRGTSHHVSLKVFDLLGREIAVLVNEDKSPGNYEVKFNAETLQATSQPSGVYFYKLSVDNYSQIKKMVLMK